MAVVFSNFIKGYNDKFVKTTHGNILAYWTINDDHNNLLQKKEQSKSFPQHPNECMKHH